MRLAQLGKGSLSGLRLILARLPYASPPPPCLVAAVNSDSWHFHRKRAGARRIRRYLRRNPVIVWLRVRT